jgi:hypothetical protein
MSPSLAEAIMNEFPTGAVAAEVAYRQEKVRQDFRRAGGRAVRAEQTEQGEYTERPARRTHRHVPWPVRRSPARRSPAQIRPS